MTAPKVFVSYSHDSPKHANRVIQLSDKLRSEGIDCILDQYETSPSEGWPRWMDRNIRSADFVLMICTQTYFKRVMGKEKPGTGLGVRWEGKLIYQHLYNEDANKRFIPILFEENTPAQIPTPLQDATCYHPSTPDGYETLYRRITKQPYATKPELGKLNSLPPRERKPDFLGPKTSLAKPPSTKAISPRKKADELFAQTQRAEPLGEAKIPFIVWFFLLGIIVTTSIAFFYDLELRCLLEYRISEAVVVLIGLLFTAIGAAIGPLMPSEIKNKFWGFGGGVLVVFLLFLIRNISLPPIPQDGCFPILSPTPTPSCITTDDILVKFQISSNDDLIATLHPLETLPLKPNKVVYFEILITSVNDETIPSFEYAWTNTGNKTGGELLHNTGRIVDYRSGQDIVEDAISMQLSQPHCLALAPYPFFVSPIKE